MSTGKIDTLIAEALDNIRNDRKVAKEFLNVNFSLAIIFLYYSLVTQ